MTLLIKNVRIVGGAKKFPERSDVFVHGNKISAIGSFPNKGADEVIDGQGAYLSPGFIDVNTDSDHYSSLLDYPEQEDFLRQGVTTIIGGMCGSSLAPLLYGGLESVQKWGDVSKVNVDWHTVEEFLSVFERKPLGVNFATLIGHSTIRRAILGESLRDLTKSELGVFGETLRRALREGGFGLSTGLGYVHSYRTPYSELKFLANVTKESDGVYATHLRKSGKEIGESIDETIKLTKEVGVKTLISHLLPLVGAEKEYESAISQIESLPKDVDLHFDLYPSDTSVFALYTFLPNWVKSGGREVMLSNLRDDWLWKKIEKDLPELDPDNFVLAQAPGNDFLIGRTLKELSAIYNVPDYQTALLKLMLATELRGLVFYKNINMAFIKRAIASPRSFVASNAASYPYSGQALKPERAVSTFTEFLTMVVRDNALSLEAAISKITSEPAQKFNLRGRGVIKEGNVADLTIFSLRDKVVPGEKYAVVKVVVVNGTVAFKEDSFQGKFAGRALKH